MQRVRSDETEVKVVQVETGKVKLEGELAIPAGAKGLVAFAHGSGSSRHSPRNKFVAEVLQEGGLATLLFDLLTADEEEVDRVTRHLRFDIEHLAERVIGATEWLLRNPETKDLNIGYFGSSTGAAAALVAAANRPSVAKAVVSRGGRPDLAGGSLRDVEAPTLLIIGGRDFQVIELNERAYELLEEPKEIEIVPGATHLFEEPGALEKVADLARDWFRKHLGTPAETS